MTTFYGDSSERVAAPMLYIKEHLPSSYQETPVLPGNMMLYMNSAPYSDTLGIDSTSQQQQQQQQQQQEILSNFNGSRVAEQDMDALRNFNTLGGSSSGILQNGLSLSLGTQIPGGGFQMSSTPYRNLNMGLVSFLSPNPSYSEEGGGSRSDDGSMRNEIPRNGDYVLRGYPGSSPDLSTVARIIPSSRYLKAAQQLLDEVVNLTKALKQPEDAKDRSGDEKQHQGKSLGDAADGGVKNDDGDSSARESSVGKELSHTEKQELQNKLTKLFSMLVEVDKRYKQYYDQMKIVASSFNAIAGPGSVKPYTGLTLQRISRHFRCLKDAINGQILTTRKGLGVQVSSSANYGIGIARLRYVDQQLRQQKALQQLGMMQPHAAWRPQRGLPESSVSILRAWLFEHFLNPYPKDSDKIMLARRAGLTRSQVSNWFINARVRLWKPMVEEMYKEEEIGDVEMDLNSSSENAVKAVKGDGTRPSEERGEDNSQRAAPSERRKEESFDPRPDHIPNSETVVGPSGAASHPSGAGDIEADYYAQSAPENTRFVSGAGDEYRMVELGRFGHGTGVSLTLGLQHFQGGTIPFSSTMHHGFVPVRRDDFYGASGSSIGTEATELDAISNPGDQYRRLGPEQQLLHDYVA